MGCSFLGQRELRSASSPRIWRRTSAFPQQHRGPLVQGPHLPAADPVGHALHCPQQDLVLSQPPVATSEVPRLPSSSSSSSRSQCVLRGCKVQLTVPGGISREDYGRKSRCERGRRPFSEVDDSAPRYRSAGEGRPLPWADSFRMICEIKLRQ